MSLGHPPQVDLYLTVGDRNRTRLEFLAEDGRTPWDLTGATVSSEVRSSVGALGVLYTATITPVDAALGIFVMEWNVPALPVDSPVGVWDVQVLEAGQTRPETIAGGSAYVRAGVTA